MEKKILLTGVKPTGRPHIGNYFGAMRQMVDLQSVYDTYIFVANFHALTTMLDPAELRKNTRDVILDYLAIGLDPEKVTFYLQSDVPEVTELAWYFSGITTVPYLMRAHAFKDAEAKNKEISVGTFNYPLLMASDILIQDADVVPVGQDQKQHMEIARDTAEKFNRTFGETFTLPEPYILEEVKIVPGYDGQKMSKSYGNTLPLFAEDDEVRNFVMKIVTDSKGVYEKKDPEACNVFALHKLVSKKDLGELEKRYKNGGIGYKESKEILLSNITHVLQPMREKRKLLANSSESISKILNEGMSRVRKRVEEKMTDVRKKIGIA